MVTGGASGMGRATARLLVDEGASVLVADRDGDGVRAVAAEIAAVHGSDRILWEEADVSSDDDRRRVVRAAVGEWGGVDVLVNNAGISRVTSVHSDDQAFTANWDETLAVNLSAHAHLIRLCSEWLQRAPHGGRVVNVASTEAIVATGGLAAYTASKHAVVGLTKSFAVELGARNVTVNAVCPGPIDTAMAAVISEADKATYARRRVPIRRYGDPEEVAHMILNLCLPSSSFVNGAVVTVDGGLTIKH